MLKADKKFKIDTGKLFDETLEFYEKLYMNTAIKQFYFFTNLFNTQSVGESIIRKSVNDVFNLDFTTELNLRACSHLINKFQDGHGFLNIILSSYALKNGCFYIPNDILLNSKTQAYRGSALPPFFLKNITIQRAIVSNENLLNYIQNIALNFGDKKLEALSFLYDDIVSIIENGSKIPSSIKEFAIDRIKGKTTLETEQALFVFFELRKTVYNVLRTIVVLYDNLYNDANDPLYDNVKKQYAALEKQFEIIISNYTNMENDYYKNLNFIQRITRRLKYA